jgi:uncharacterized membrane protein
MTFALTMAPLAGSSFAIQLHAAAAVGALLIGAWQMFGRKGTVPHRLLGWLWVGLMAIVAVSSFWISEIKTFGRFSAIHLLSIGVLIQLPIAVYAARVHKISLHKNFMTGLFVFALVITGLFTLLPGRIMHRVIFG